MTIKKTIQSLLPGWNGRLAAHHVGYLGDGHVHRGVPYSATNASVIAQKLALMQSNGIDICIETWQGPYATSCALDATLTSAQCAKIGMQFCLLLDPWCAKLTSTGQNTDYTQNVTNALNDSATKTMLNATSYVPEKYILDFNTGADLVALGKTFPQYKFLAMNAGFSWITIPNITDSTQRNAAAVSNLKSQHQNPAMKVASVCFEFNDSGQPQPVGVQTQVQFDADGGVRDYSTGVWGNKPARVLESFSGLFGRQQIATIPTSMPIIAIVTWDDYDEQSSGPLEKQLAEEQGIVWA